MLKEHHNNVPNEHVLHGQRDGSYSLQQLPSAGEKKPEGEKKIVFNPSFLSITFIPITIQAI